MLIDLWLSLQKTMHEEWLAVLGLRNRSFDFFQVDPKADWRCTIRRRRRRRRRNFHYTMCLDHESAQLYDIGILIRLEARGCDW